MPNSKSSQSRYLKQSQMADLIDAAAFADWQEIPMTRAITFNLKGLEDRAQDFLIRYFKLAGDWLRTKGCARAYVWVLEHPPAKSLNAHILFHVPAQLMGDFAKRERRWMKEAGLPWRKGRLAAERIADRGNKGRGYQSPGELLANTENALGYMLKGGAPEACAALRVDDVWQGYVQGKRCGVSQSIGSAARNAKGYRVPVNGRSSMLFRWRCSLSKAE